MRTTKTTDRPTTILEAPVFLPEPARRPIFEPAVIEQFVSTARAEGRDPIAATAEVEWSDAHNGVVRVRVRS